MFSANLTSYFIKKAKKVINKNQLLAIEVDNVIKQLELNPKEPSLKSHKVKTPKNNLCFSSRINGDIRLIWN